MKTIEVLALSAAALAFSGASLAGDSAVALSAGVGTLGYGLDLSKRVSDNINGRVGFNTYDYSKSLSKDNVEYDAKLKLSNLHLLADWYPFGGTFRATAGLVSNGNKFTLNAKPTGGTYTLNDVTYQATDIGSLSGEVDFKSAVPYIAVGWGNPVASGKGWGVTVDLGAMYQGSPTSKLNVTCAAGLPSATCTQIQSSAAAQQTKLDSSMSSFKWWPIATVAVSYQF